MCPNSFKNLPYIIKKTGCKLQASRFILYIVTELGFTLSVHKQVLLDN